MSRYSDVKKDDAVFATRLQEVNQELDTLLHKTSRTRHEMDRAAAEVRMGVPLNFYPQDARGGASDSAEGGVGSSSSGSSARDDLARGIVSAELSVWARRHLPDLVKPLVDAEVQRHLQTLREGLEEVQSRQQHVETAMAEVTAQLRANRRDLQAGWADFQRSIERDVAAHHRTVEQQLRAWRDEVQQVQERLLLLQESSRGEAARIDRQLDAAVQRQRQQAHETFADMDRDLQRWRMAVQRELGETLRGMQSRHDSLEGQVAELEGSMASAADGATRCAAELQQCLDDAVIRGSEVRRCRSDVNRLEMLLQCAALQTVGATPQQQQGKKGKTARKARAEAAETAGAEGDDAAALAASASLSMLPQEVSHLGEKMHAIVARVDGLDRQVRQLDIAVARGAVGLGRPPYVDAARELAEDSLYSRSAASTRRFSSSQHSSMHAGRNPYQALSRSTPAHLHSVLSNPSDDRPSSLYRGTADEASVERGSHRSVVPQLRGGAAASGPRAVLGSLSRQAAMAEARPARPVPQPVPPSQPTASQLSNESLPPFEDYAEDPRPMPVTVRDSTAAPAVVSGGVVASSGFVSHGGSPGQRRTPPRVIPVEPVPASSEDEEDVEAAPAGSGAARVLPMSDSRGSSKSSSHDGKESSVAAGKGTRHGNDSPFAFSLDRYGAAFLMGGSNAGQPAEHESGGYASAAAELPAAAAAVAGYAASASPSDSYVSDTPAGGGAGDGQPLQPSGRYTPAPASDTEEERDNEVISRSALD